MIIKDRLIEVDAAEALALAGVGEEVRCVGEGTGLIDLEDALEGLTFFVYEGKLAAREKPEPLKMCMTPPKAAASYDTPEGRTRAILDSVERHDEEHGDQPVTKQDAESAEDVLRKHAPKSETPKAEPPKAEAPKTDAPKADAPKAGVWKEIPAGFIPFPFAGAPSGGGALKK